jgi:hypothetical protein
MIIYGRKTALLVRRAIQDECSDCGAENSIDLSLYQKYRYFLGIPLSPAGKMPMTECANCRKVLEKCEFSPSLLQHYQTIKKETKTPAWTFFGSALFVSLIGLCCLFLFLKAC